MSTPSDPAADPGPAARPLDASPTTRPRRRGLRILWWIVASLIALILIAMIALIIYSQVGVMAAESAPAAAVKADDRIMVTDDGGAIVLAPASGASGVGLVYIPGAKVDPWAYASKMSGVVVDDGVTVVITRPWLNLAFFDLRPLSVFTDLEPEVDEWIVGGHSLGGVRACQLAGGADGLALFASYCATDLSASALPVISISGSQDGVSTPQDIADNRDLLPADAEFVEIEGASHSSFGDYGPQSGDGTPTITDEEMTARLTELVGAFAASLSP